MQKLKSWITYPQFGSPLTLWKRMHTAEKAVSDLPGYKEAITEFRRPYVGFIIMLLTPIFILGGAILLGQLLGWVPDPLFGGLLSSEVAKYCNQTTIIEHCHGVGGN